MFCKFTIHGGNATPSEGGLQLPSRGREQEHARGCDGYIFAQYINHGALRDSLKVSTIDFPPDDEFRSDSERRSQQGMLGCWFGLVWGVCGRERERAQCCVVRRGKGEMRWSWTKNLFFAHSHGPPCLRWVLAVHPYIG